jgi:hypothetical protein
VECITDVPAPDISLVTANDNCGPATVVFVSDLNDGQFCPTTIMRTYQANDVCGNSSTCQQIILIQDFTPPDLNCPQDIAISCQDPVTPAFTGTATATDNCDLTPVVTFTDVVTNGGCPANKVITRTWTATDICANESSCIQVITQQDLIPPLITSCPSNMSRIADGGMTYATISLPPPVYSDNCTLTSNISVTWTMTSPTAGSGSGIIPDPFQFNLGTTTITYTFTDACGNVSDCSFTITVTPNDPPDITCPADINRTTDPGLCSAALDPGFPTKVSGTDPIIYTWIMTGATAGSGTGAISPNPYTFNSGITTITWAATNISGFDACSQTITVLDVQPPAFTLPVLSSGYCVEGFLQAVYNPGGIYYVNDLTPPRRDYYTVVAGSTLLDLSGISDNCPGPVTIAWAIDFGNNGITDLSGTGQISLSTPIDFPLGDNLITWTVTDANGNSTIATSIFKVLPRPDIN